jgi:hypothetical protein
MALHARAIEFIHPANDAIMSLEARRPAALEALVEGLRMAVASRRRGREGRR